MGDKIKASIIDDEQKALDLLDDMLGSHDEVEVVDKIKHPHQAFQSLVKHKPELIFLDIQMPYKDGFDLLDDFRHLSFRPDIIFTTSYEKHAIQAFKYSVFDYLLKPIDPEDLFKSIERYKKHRTHLDTGTQQTAPLLPESTQKLKFQSCEGIVFYEKNEILYAEASRNYTILHLTHSRQSWITMNLGKVEKLLEFPPFYRISRSVIINTSYLTRIYKKKNLCELENDGQRHELPIPTKNISLLNQKL